jgi:hypothetical protein
MNQLTEEDGHSSFPSSEIETSGFKFWRRYLIIIEVALADDVPAMFSDARGLEVNRHLLSLTYKRTYRGERC